MLIRFRKGFPFRRHVAVVPAVIWRTEFFDELEGDANAFLRIAHRVGTVVPRPLHRARAERIAARPAKGVPIHHRKAQMLPHGLASNPFVGVIVLERKRVLGSRPFVLNGRNIFKAGGHNYSGFFWWIKGTAGKIGDREAFVN